LKNIFENYNGEIGISGRGWKPGRNIGGEKRKILFK
jgi:hypothetical protein